MEFNKIVEFLNRIGVFFKDEIKDLFRKNKTTFDDFLRLDDDQLRSIGFLQFSIEKIKFGKNNLNVKDIPKTSKQLEEIKPNHIDNKVSLKEDESNSKQIIPHDENLSIKTMNEEEKPYSLRFLTVPKDRNIYTREADFTEMIKENLTKQDVIAAIGSKNFILHLKPFLLDMLKRCAKFNNLMNTISEISSDKNQIKDIRKILKTIEERDLLVALIESVLSKYHAHLGQIIAKNDYAVPLLYQYYEEDIGKQIKFNFELFTYLLSAIDKALVVVSGTQKAVFKGKSSFITSIFPGLNKNSVAVSKKSSSETRMDIICNEETNENWIIADFHGQIETNNIEIMNLFSAFCAFSSIHIINCTLEDFDMQSLYPNSELNQLLESHKTSKQENAQTLLIVLIRDFNIRESENETSDVDSDDDDGAITHQMIETIRKNLKENKFLRVFPLQNIKVKPNTSKTKGIVSVLTKQFDDHLQNRGNLTKKFFIQEIKRIFKSNKIKESIDHFDPTVVQKEFDSLFNFSEDFENRIKDIFQLSKLSQELNEIENTLLKMQSTNEEISHEKSEKLKNNKKELQKKKENIDPKNKFIQFFYKLVLDKNYEINLVIFEKFLINFKQKHIKELKEKRCQLSMEYESERAQLNQFDKESLEYNEIRDRSKTLEDELKKTMNKIEALDLTIDKFWDEILLILERDITDAKNDEIVNKYIDFVHKGSAIHILRGTPLSLECTVLNTVFNNLNFKNIYVVSVIGEQSSAKSSLLNSLFGCNFRTSAGRCTAGIYMHFAQFEGRTIVILDTEGLMSVDSGNKVFDNQMATMAVLSSHLIIVNHKGEISANLERLLGMTFYAKLRIANSKFKPSIVFVLRDQTERDPNAAQQQVIKIKQRLNEQSNYVNSSLENVLNIQANNMFLLANAFSEEQAASDSKKTLKWRNKIFSSQILELRKFILDNLFNQQETETDFFSIL